MLESTACLTTLFLSVAAGVVGLSCPSSAQTHTLILLIMSGERMVMASSCQHLNSVSWVSANSSSSVSITIIDFLNNTISGNGLHRKQDKQNMNASRSWAKGLKILALAPQHQIGSPLHSWQTRTGKDKVNPYHFPLYLSLVLPDPAGHMFLYLLSHCKIKKFSQLRNSRLALATSCFCSSQGKSPHCFLMENIAWQDLSTWSQSQ